MIFRDHLYSSSLQCGIICFTVTVVASGDMVSPLLPANFKGQKSLGTTFAACAGCRQCDSHCVVMRLTSSRCILLVIMIIPLVMAACNSISAATVWIREDRDEDLRSCRNA